MKTQSIILGWLATFAGLSLLACGCDRRSASPQTQPGARKLVVGYSQIGAESDWRKANTESIVSEARARGVELKLADAQQKQENQVAALREFVQMKVDVIVLSPVVTTGWEPILKDIRKAGIPVILSDRMVDVSDPSLYTTFLGTDVIEEGRRAARWLAGKMNNQARIAELVGTPGSAPAIERKAGFEEVLQDLPGMKIIKSQTGDFTRAKGKEVMEQFLKSPEGRQINALYAHNDDMALGAIQAIEEAGLKPGNDIVIVSVDGVRGAFEAMVEGKLNCTVECNPLLGPQLFDLVQKIAAGQAVPKRVTVAEGVFDQSVAKDELPKRKY